MDGAAMTYLLIGIALGVCGIIAVLIVIGGAPPPDEHEPHDPGE